PIRPRDSCCCRILPLSRSLSSSHVCPVVPVVPVQISTAIDPIVWTYCAFLSHNDFLSPSSVWHSVHGIASSGRTVCSLRSVGPSFFAKSSFFYFFFSWHSPCGN